MRIADRLGLTPAQRADLYYAELLMDAGCTAWTSQMAAFVMGDEIVARREIIMFADQRNPIDVLTWARDYLAAGAPMPTRLGRLVDFVRHGPEMMREGFRNTCEVAQRFAGRLGMSGTVQTAMLSIFEQWDGGGPNGARGEAIPLVSRIVYATSFFEAFHRLGGRAAAVRLARRRRGAAFDPVVVDAFLSLSEDDGFWADLERESAWERVLALEPASPHWRLPEEKLGEVALSFADFADLKSCYAAGHSRRVAELAERVARRLSLPAAEMATIRLAALTHDIGLVVVPSFILERPPEKLTQAEWEQVRLHPYHAERILSTVAAFAPALPLVAAHHERLDGQGYYRGLAGAQIPLGARVIAVADRFDELTHDGPAGPALDDETALSRMSEEAGRGLCPDAFRALTHALGGEPADAAARGKSRQPAWPAGLTNREVEVLRLLTRGLSRRQVAGELFVSEHTVRSHLEHIYAKIGVSTRVAATLFAVEHDLLT
jgi:HD-GYP domain-containing protein (c-di-GMP phosphodiesterase class II)